MSTKLHMLSLAIVLGGLSWTAVLRREGGKEGGGMEKKRRGMEMGEGGKWERMGGKERGLNAIKARVPYAGSRNRKGNGELLNLLSSFSISCLLRLFVVREYLVVHQRDTLKK